MESNLHHTLYTRRTWEADGTTRRLRNDGRTQIVLPVWIHNTLHQECEPIIPPNPTIAREALRLISSYPSSWNNVDRIRKWSDELIDIHSPMAEGLHEQIPFFVLGTKALKQTIISVA